MDYSLEWKFLEYTCESMTNQALYIAAMNESMMIAEGNNTVENMMIVHEGVAEKVKGFIAKIVEGLSKIWGRFTETMSELVKRDSGYLQKYKDIITKKQFKQDYTFTMYDRPKGVGNILNTPVPVFNYNSLKDKLESEDTFLDFFPRLKSVKNGLKDNNITFKELCTIAFNGSENEVSISCKSLNMTDIYNYCVNYQSNIKKAISADSKNLQAAAKDAEAKVQQLARESKQESTDLFEDDLYRSLLYENAFLNEAVTATVNGQPANKADKDPDEKSTSNELDKAKDTKDPNKAYQGTQGNKKEISGDDDSNDIEDMLKRVQLYVKLVGEIMTAKMSAAENAYKDYMSIIRSHVKDHVGSKDKSTDKAADKATVQGKDNSTYDSSKIDMSKLPS